jgi:hypothetical protein
MFTQTTCYYDSRVEKFRDSEGGSHGFPSNVANLNAKAADREFSMAQVVERLRVVESQSEYRAMARMRFLSTFKRDHLPAEYDSTHPDSECIKEGNRQVHDPDPLGDADLYLHGHRSDENAFKDLYGISPLRVNALSESCHDHTVW